MFNILFYLALTYDLHKNTFICVQNKVSYNIKIPGGLFLICSYSSPSGIDSFLTKFVLIYFPSIIIIIEILFPDLIQPVIYCKQLFFTHFVYFLCFSGLACHLTGNPHHIDHSEYRESIQHLHHATVHSTALCLCLSKALKQFLHDFISILIRHNIAHRII